MRQARGYLPAPSLPAEPSLPYEGDKMISRLKKGITFMATIYIIITLVYGYYLEATIMFIALVTYFAISYHFNKLREELEGDKNEGDKV